MAKQIRGQLRLFTDRFTWVDNDKRRANRGEIYVRRVRDRRLSSERRRHERIRELCFIPTEPILGLLADRKRAPDWRRQLAFRLWERDDFWAGTTPESWERWLKRLESGQRRVRIDKADKLCLAIGAHLSMLVEFDCKDVEVEA